MGAQIVPKAFLKKHDHRTWLCTDKIHFKYGIGETPREAYKNWWKKIAMPDTCILDREVK